MNTFLQSKNLFSLLLVVVIGNACSKIEDGSIKPPLVYRIDIQQGNVIEQSMINKLRVGMDKNQVKFIMGSPLLEDPFHYDRWDYIYTYQEGGRQRQKRHITLYFEDEKLSHITGDVKVTHVPVRTEETNREKSVVVPATAGDKTLLERWLADDEPELEQVNEDADITESATAEETETAIKQSADPTGETALSAPTTPADADITNEQKGGFFSNLWDKMAGDDDATPADAELLQPDLQTGSEPASNETDNSEEETGISTVQQDESTVAEQTGPVEAEPVDESEGSFFSNLWDKISGDEADESQPDPERQ